MTDMREAVARAIAKDDVRWLLMSSAEQSMVMFYVGQAIAAARPYIREECAKVADNEADRNGYFGRLASKRIAAAIRKDVK